MEFKNRHNIPHEINGKIIWESRSVAITGVVFLFKNNQGYVLSSTRGPKSADFQGKMNLVAGYLDWDETGLDAFIREAWEETGFDITSAILKYKVLHSDTHNPWAVSTKINENRQNVSLRYGIVFQLENDDDFPELTIEHNEIEGETENPQWLSLEYFQNYEWAFNHDKVINSYMLKLIQDGKII